VSDQRRRVDKGVVVKSVTCLFSPKVRALDLDSDSTMSSLDYDISPAKVGLVVASVKCIVQCR